MDIFYQPKFERTAGLVKNLTEASGLKSWMDQQALDVSWIAASQRDALIRLAHYSTRIEGNPLTLPEVVALAEGKDFPAREHAKREVLNYFSALRWIWKTSLGYKINEKKLLNLHKILTQGILPKSASGSYKMQPNAVFLGRKIIYKPPPPEAAPLLTRSLLVWLNGNSGREEHPIIVSAIAHHRLVSIHPFSDGNGRAARALESWILYRRGFDTHHIFALDEFFDVDRERYYKEIQAVRKKEDDLTSWLEYVSEGVLKTLKKTQLRIQSFSRQDTLRAQHGKDRIVLTPKQERVLQILAQSSRLGGGELARSIRITRSHLSKILRPLLNAGLVAKEGSTKSAAYKLPRNKPYAEIM